MNNRLYWIIGLSFTAAILIGILAFGNPEWHSIISKFQELVWDPLGHEPHIYKRF